MGRSPKVLSQIFSLEDCIVNHDSVVIIVFQATEFGVSDEGTVKGVEGIEEN